MPKTLLVGQSVTLTDAQIEEIFRERLSALKQGMWIDNRGRLMAEGCTSHRFDYEVEVDDSSFKLRDIVAAVQHLETLLGIR